MEYVGTDKKGFRYFINANGYVYQQGPTIDYFSNGKNLKDKIIGWFCSVPAWHRTLHKITL